MFKKLLVVMVWGRFPCLLVFILLLPSDQSFSHSLQFPSELAILSAQNMYDTPYASLDQYNKQNTYYTFFKEDGSLQRLFPGPQGRILKYQLIEHISYILVEQKAGVFVEAYDIQKGRKLWSDLVCSYDIHKTCDNIFYSIGTYVSFHASHLIYVLTLRKQLELKAINGKNGTTLWSVPLSHLDYQNGFHIDADNQFVYVSDQLEPAQGKKNRLLVFDTHSGKLEKTIVIPEAIQNSRTENGILYFSGFDNDRGSYLYALRISDEKILWNLTIPSFEQSIHWEIDNDILYLQLENELRAINLKTSSIAWRNKHNSVDPTLPTNVFLGPTQLGVMTDAVYEVFHTSDNKILFALLNKEDGKNLWHTSFSGRPLHTFFADVVFVSDREIYMDLFGESLQWFLNRTVVVSLNKENGLERWCRTLLYSDTWADCSASQPAVAAVDIRPFVGQWFGSNGSILIEPNGKVLYTKNVPFPEKCKRMQCDYKPTEEVRIVLTKKQGNDIYGVILPNKSTMKQAIRFSVLDDKRLKLSDETVVCRAGEWQGVCEV